jgi:hypothetical protein
MGLLDHAVAALGDGLKGGQMAARRGGLSTRGGHSEPQRQGYCQ